MRYILAKLPMKAAESLDRPSKIYLLFMQTLKAVLTLAIMAKFGCEFIV